MMQRRANGIPYHGRALDTKKSSGLGKDANIVATSQDAGKYRAFRQLGFAQHLLYEYDVKSDRSGNIHRTRLCHAARSGHVEKISLNVSTSPDAKEASLSGVQTCGSIWSCPVCARRIAVERGKEIGYTIDKMIETGHVPLLISLTARHTVVTRLNQFNEQFKQAWRYFTQSRKWRKLKELMGIEHNIKAIEVTHTHKNGFHRHQHGVLFAHADNIKKASAEAFETWQADVTKHWLHCLKKAGLDGTFERACDIRISKDIKRDYLSKLGMEEKQSGKLDYELSGNANKDYYGRNIWAILNSASTGNEQDAKLYVEYVQAMSGTNWITFSRGLKDLVGLDEIEDETIASDDSNDQIEYEPLLEISDYEYEPVRAFRAYGDLLEIAASTRDRDTVINWLSDLRETYDKSEAHNKRKRMLEQFNSVDAWLANYRQQYNKRKTNDNPSPQYFEYAEKWKSLKRQLGL